MIDYINLSGKDYPCSLGFAALREAERESKKSLSQLMADLTGLSIDDTVHLCYLALKHGARKAGQPFDLSIEQVADLLDEQGKLNELSTLIGEQLGKIFGQPVKEDLPVT